jgi:hypothetical protein
VDEVDRRLHPRYPLRAALDVEGDPEPIPVDLVDISLGGTRFLSRHPFPVQAGIRLIFDFWPVDFPLRALVIWQKPAGPDAWEHGAEFINVPPAEGTLVRHYIEELRRGLAAPPPGQGSAGRPGAAGGQ